jgi:hypothetical protein
VLLFISWKTTDVLSENEREPVIDITPVWPSSEE